MNINNRVKRLRSSLGLSQAKFSAAISISNGYIGTIEVGKRIVNERIIKLICSEFNVNEEWLRNGNGEMFNQKSVLDKKLAEVTDIFESLDPDFQNYALQQMDALLELQEKALKKESVDTAIE